MADRETLRRHTSDGQEINHAPTPLEIWESLTPAQRRALAWYGTPSRERKPVGDGLTWHEREAMNALLGPTYQGVMTIALTDLGRAVAAAGKAEG